MKEKPKTHILFMQQLKAMLPEDCQPIIVTDAGFRIPWFKLVESLGWDFVGRVRNKTHCKKVQDNEWAPVKSLYQLGTLRPKDLGIYQQGEKIGFESRMSIVWRKSKGRKDKTATGERARRSKKSRACAEREKEPPSLTFLSSIKYWCTLMKSSRHRCVQRRYLRLCEHPHNNISTGGLAPSNLFTDPAFLHKGWKSTCLLKAFLLFFRIKPITNAIKS